MRLDRGTFPLHRLEGLSDGIFAIVMTLLVLNIPLPGAEHGVESDGDLFNFLMGTGRLYQTFAVSFLMLAIFWITLQKLYRHLRRTCTAHMWASLASLFFVCLVPFSSSLIGKYDQLFVSNCFFHLNIFFIAVFILLQWATVSKHPDMLREGIGTDVIRKGVRINLVLPVIAIGGVCIAAFEPVWSTAVYALAPFLVSRIRSRH